MSNEMVPKVERDLDALHNDPTGDNLHSFVREHGDEKMSEIDRRVAAVNGKIERDPELMEEVMKAKMLLVAVNRAIWKHNEELTPRNFGEIRLFVLAVRGVLALA